jgi:hypothetical protein
VGQQDIYIVVLIKRLSKGKALHELGFVDAECSSSLRFRGFLDNRLMKVAMLSALRTGRLYPPGKIPGTYFC